MRFPDGNEVRRSWYWLGRGSPSCAWLAQPTWASLLPAVSRCPRLRFIDP